MSPGAGTYFITGALTAVGVGVTTNSAFAVTAIILCGANGGTATPIASTKDYLASAGTGTAGKLTLSMSGICTIMTSEYIHLQASSASTSRTNLTLVSTRPDIPPRVTVTNTATGIDVIEVG